MTSEKPDVTYYPKFSRAFLNCPMEYRCNADWFALVPTDCKDVRHCKTCDKDVHFCTDQTQLDAHAAQGHCVAFYEGRQPSSPTVRPPGMTVGLPGYLIRDGIAVSRSNRVSRVIDELQNF